MLKSEIVRDWAFDHVGCPYIMGAVGADCSPEYRKARMAQYPDYAEKIRDNCPRLKSGKSNCAGCKWATPGDTTHGRPAYDCAQFTRRAWEQIGINLISGANSQWLQKYVWRIKGAIDQMPKDAVCSVFRRDDGKMGHTGLYLGDGNIIHAKGHAYGVVLQRLEDCNFTHYAIPIGVDEEMSEPTVKRGDSGEAVKRLQTLLIKWGYNLPMYGADGKYGAETYDALTSFQLAHGISNELGFCGPETWAALEAQTTPAPDVLLSALVSVRANLLTAYDTINKALERYGGDNNG